MRSTRCIAIPPNWCGKESAHAIRRRLKPFRGAQFQLDQRMGASFEEHRKVVDAILRGDADGARAAMNAHVRVVGEASEQFAAEPQDEPETSPDPTNDGQQFAGPDETAPAEETDT